MNNLNKNNYFPDYVNRNICNYFDKDFCLWDGYNICVKL